MSITFSSGFVGLSNHTNFVLGLMAFSRLLDSEASTNVVSTFIHAAAYFHRNKRLAV
jgi:hypothetical protein